MEYGNSNSESIVLGERWSPLLFGLIWLLTAALALALSLINPTMDPLSRAGLWLWALSAPGAAVVFGLMEGRERVDYVRASADEVLVVYRYFPFPRNKEVRMTQRFSWEHVKFVGYDEEGEYSVALEFSPSVPPLGNRAILKDKKYSSLEEAQRIAKEWNVCRGGLAHTNTV